MYSPNSWLSLARFGGPFFLRALPTFAATRGVLGQLPPFLHGRMNLPADPAGRARDSPGARRLMATRGGLVGAFAHDAPARCVTGFSRKLSPWRYAKRSPPPMSNCCAVFE